MTESQQTARIVRELRKRLPQAFIAKISDRWTGGIPDVVITYGETWWIEAKREGGKLTALQADALRRIGKNALVVTYHDDGRVTIKRFNDEAGLSFVDWREAVTKFTWWLVPFNG